MQERPSPSPRNSPDPLLEEDKPLRLRRTRRPPWLDLLTPLSILVAGAAIAAALWVGRSGNEGRAGAAPAGSPEGGFSAAAPGAARQAPASLLQAFLDYGREVGLDNSAFQSCLFDSSSAATVTEHLRRGSSLGVSGTPTFFINDKKVVGAQPPAVFQEIIDRELAGSPSEISDYSATIQALAATDPPRFEIVSAPPDVSDAVFEGSPDATVIIAEFSDFQCPFCKRWAEETLPVLRPRLGDEVALAFLHFPILQIHPNAGNASVAAYCASLQGKFWEMHDLLFERQQEWQALPN